MGELTASLSHEIKQPIAATVLRELLKAGPVWPVFKIEFPHSQFLKDFYSSANNQAGAPGSS
jgi:hypothetical protein